MTATMEQANATLKAAVKARMDATPKDDPKMVGYSAEALPEPRKFYPSAEESQTRSDTYAEWEPAFRGDSLLNDERTPAERTLHHAIEAVRDRHGKYGPPTEHFARTASLVNAAFGTTFTAADWALVMVLDKIARQLGTQATDDAAIDIAGYAACHQECRRG